MVRFPTDRLFRHHCVLILVLLALHLISRAVYFARGEESYLMSTFNFLEETSVPTVVSTAALLAAAAVAGLIAAHARQNASGLAGGWTLIALCLAFVAVDEGAGLHDRLSIPLQRLFATSGVFYIGWLLPYLVLVAFVALRCVPLLFKLPRRTTLRLVAAGALYVAAAMGLEMAESLVMYGTAGEGVALADIDLHSIDRTPLMIGLVTVEEVGEMLAVALLLRALLLHLVGDLGVSAVALQGPGGRSVVAAGAGI